MKKFSTLPAANVSRKNLFVAKNLRIATIIFTLLLLGDGPEMRAYAQGAWTQMANFGDFNYI